MSLKQVFKKISVIDDFFKFGMLINQRKNICLKYYGILVQFEFSYQLDKLFFLPKSTKHFSLMIRCRYNALPFCSDSFLVFFYDGRSILEFLCFLRFLVQLFCFYNIVDRYGIYQLLFDFFFSEPSCLFGIFRTSPQL